MAHGDTSNLGTFLPRPHTKHVNILMSARHVLIHSLHCVDAAPNDRMLHRTRRLRSSSSRAVTMRCNRMSRVQFAKQRIDESSFEKRCKNYRLVTQLSDTRLHPDVLSPAHGSRKRFHWRGQLTRQCTLDRCRVLTERGRGNICQGGRQVECQYEHLLDFGAEYSSASRHADK